MFSQAVRESVNGAGDERPVEATASISMQVKSKLEALATAGYTVFVRLLQGAQNQN